MKNKPVSILIFLIIFYSQLICSCYPPNQPMVRMGPDVKSSLVVFFKKDTTYDEINEFDRTVIGVPDPKGNGYSSLPGMVSVVFINKGEYKGKAIEFKPNATEEQKAFVKQRVTQSPIVYRVYENVVPDEIKDLE